MRPAQAQSYRASAAIGSTGTGTGTMGLPVPETHHDGRQHPPNAAHMQHTVNFRRPWEPSPEMRGLFPLPSTNSTSTSRRGSRSMHASAHPHTHTHTQRPVLPPPVARARSPYVPMQGGGDREKRAGGGYIPHRRSQSQSQSHSHSQPMLGNEPWPFARARPRAATVTGAGTGLVGMGSVHAPSGTAARRSVHIVGGLGVRGQAPAPAPASAPDGAVRQTWIGGRERGAQRGRHADDGGREGEAEAIPELERANGLQWNAIRRSANTGSGSQRDRPKSWLSLLHPKRLFRFGRSRIEAEEAEAEYDDVANWRYSTAREVTPAQWRAYGAWARPYIDRPWGMVVHNATPLNPPRELSPPQVHAMIATLRDPDGTLHPERWMPRVEHPSLPPRPDLWPTPQVEALELLPEELQLNPFLQHRIVGRPPLHFDLRCRAEDILLGAGTPEPGPGIMSTSAGPSTSTTAPYSAGRARSSTTTTSTRAYAPGTLVALYVDGPNGAQPATYPGVPGLKISALAGDPYPEFRWPVTVIAHHERLVVQVVDVVHALIANFEERMFQEEVDELSEDRKTIVFQAYRRRMRLAVGGVTPPEDDGLRRVDYLGDATYFRGLAPAGDGDGFMLFLGLPP